MSNGSYSLCCQMSTSNENYSITLEVGEGGGGDLSVDRLMMY